MAHDIIKLIYNRSPYNIKVLFTSLYGLQKRYKSYGKYYFEQIQFLNESQYWSLEKLAAYQNQRMREFVKDILLKVPFYKDNPDYSNLRKNFSDIRDFPILSKKLVKNKLKEFYNLDQKKVIWSKTSGTTGSPIFFPITRETMQKEYAYWNMAYNWNGVCLHCREKIAMIAGHPVAWHGRTKPPFWTFDLVNNRLYFSSYHISEFNLKFYIKKLEEFNPILLHGYPSSIYLLALAYQKHGMKKLNLKAIYTSAETLLDFQRNKIESVFQAKVFNYYGTSEPTSHIIECEKNELHLKAESSFVEILNNDNQPCKPGETGRIVTTNFNSTAFPLIRYDVGDLVTISKSQVSKCGRSGLLIDNIEGRTEDYIITPDGRIVGRLDHLFKDDLDVIEAQVEQRRIEEVILRIVRGINYSKKDEIFILKAARTRLGNSMKVTFEYVDEIPRTSSGKFRFIVSKIDPSNIKVFTNS